jgi:hypothetical protein
MKIDVGPSAPPIILIADASCRLNPIATAPISEPKIPNCAAPPRIAVLGFDKSGPKSVIAPTPIKISRGKNSLAIPML